MFDIVRVTVFFVAAVCSVAGVVAAVDPLVGDKATVSSEATNPGFRRSLNFNNAPGKSDSDDARGGDQSLLLRIDNGPRRVGGFQVPFGDEKLPSGKSLEDVRNLGSVAFDYKIEPSLYGQEVTFKIYCNTKPLNGEESGSKKDIVATLQQPTIGEWATATFDLSSTKFRGFVPKQRDLTLDEWFDEGWCVGKDGSGFGPLPKNREISELLITVGQNNATYETSVEVYFDYIRMGANAKTYDLEGYPDDTGFEKVPESPTDLTAVAGDGFAVISFTQPDSVVTVDNYSWSADDTNYTPLDPADSSPRITIAPLTNGTPYSITLRAVHITDSDEQVSSAPSASVDVTPVATNILPGAPVIDSVQPGSRQITINFTQPPIVVSGESAIEDYILLVSGEEAGEIGQTQSPLIVEGGANGESYTVSIAAKNSDGVGPDSNQVDVTLPPDTDGDGVPDSEDACPTDPTCSVLPVPVLPWPALLMLLGLLGWYGRRQLAS
jgi:hypothetical protein